MTSIRGVDRSASTNTSASEREELIAALQDKDRRRHLSSVMRKRTLAEQIRELRLARGWTQSDLAQLTSKVQETISQLENPNYGNYTIKTLERLADAFDVELTVRFDPFSELVRRMLELRPEDLAVPDFEHDPGLHTGPSVPESTHTDQLISVRGDFTGKKHLRLLSITPSPPFGNSTTGSTEGGLAGADATKIRQLGA